MTNDQYRWYKCLRTINYGFSILRRVFVKVVHVKTGVTAKQFTKPKTTIVHAPIITLEWTLSNYNRDVWRWEDCTHPSFNQWQHNQPAPSRSNENCAQMIFGSFSKLYWNNGWQDTGCDRLTADPSFIWERRTKINE